MHKRLEFIPLTGFSSCHLQTIISAFKKPKEEPPSFSWKVSLPDGDALSCEMSQPDAFEKIVLLVHGLGGSHESGYMVRIAKKLYDKGICACRVNLRGAGSGKGLSKRSYHAGRSDDLLAVLEAIKRAHPEKRVSVVGFSLGANIVLKLAGELAGDAHELIEQTVAVCAPLDLYKTVLAIQRPKNALYHRYYLKKIEARTKTLYAFDDTVTAPLWGFRNALEYYDASSSRHFLGAIQHKCRLLFSEDDPFIPYSVVEEAFWHDVEVYTTQYGGHMGYLGPTQKRYDYYWMDEKILDWVS